MPPTLIITNDFPPTIGGIEGFVFDLCGLLDDNVVVLTRHTRGWQVHDQELPFPVIRSGSLLLPQPTIARLAAKLIKEHKINSVIFGAMAPLALLAPAVRAAGADRLLAISHGHETWWASLPGSSGLLHRMADEVDHVSTISDYTRRRIGPALSARAGEQLIMLSPPVDLDLFRPAAIAADDHGRPRCVAVGRMVRQKGFDTLLRAWRLVLDRGWTGPDPELVLVGDGPQARTLRRLAGRLGLTGTVRFTGSLPRTQVARVLRTGRLFALPVRTRLAGLNPEGLGIVFAEASASGLPVIAGRSGGAPETVREGETGFVVDPDDPHELAQRIVELLADPDRARRMGAAGRKHVADRYGQLRARRTVRAALGLDAA
ncbi:glycosyltransferase family 4 protein [Microlunatus elymi]|uniref:Glycosyltransferase family 4 protein n=1 Tax=Microlunatus elymi TaxID=2596828 RepID=A0A516Q2H9_9ACTN|nr:glycosyltransferase family 4 protein [Microlunatus elymi]QDP97633.1 glycosyltransferase family 4 protein [Microlunatus elymi]